MRTEEQPESRSHRYEKQFVLRNPAPALLTMRGNTVKLVRVKTGRDMTGRGFIYTKGNEDNANSDLFGTRFRNVVRGLRVGGGDALS